MERAIETKKLVMTYGKGQAKFEALKGIDLAVNMGELFAIMGPSGSGKDHTLDDPGTRHRAYRETVDSGWRQHLQRSARDFQKLRRKKIGFIFQCSNLIPFLTAEENIVLTWS